jgi:hypothetical protein
MPNQILNPNDKTNTSAWWNKGWSYTCPLFYEDPSPIGILDFVICHSFDIWILEFDIKRYSFSPAAPTCPAEVLTKAEALAKEGAFVLSRAPLNCEARLTKGDYSTGVFS